VPFIGARRAGQSSLEHFPEKACPGLDPGWAPISGLPGIALNIAEVGYSRLGRFSAENATMQSGVVDSARQPA